MTYQQHKYQYQQTVSRGGDGLQQTRTAMPNHQASPSHSLPPTSTYGRPTAPAMSYSSSTDSNNSAYATSISSMSSSPRIRNDYLSMSPPDYSNTASYTQQGSLASHAPPSYEAVGHGSPLSPSRSPSRDAKRQTQERSTERYVCLFPKCTSSFSRPADLSRHQISVHVRTTVDCPKPRCSRKGENGFTRQDHLNEHLRQYHGEKIEKRTSSRPQKTASQHR